MLPGTGELLTMWIGKLNNTADRSTGGPPGSAEE